MAGIVIERLIRQDKNGKLCLCGLTKFAKMDETLEL